MADTLFSDSTSTADVCTLSLHDALPISTAVAIPLMLVALFAMGVHSTFFGPIKYAILPQHLHKDEVLAGTGLVERSEEHTSELQSQSKLVCRLLLENRTSAISTYTGHSP